MLSANALAIPAGASVVVIIVIGRTHGTSWPTIVARCALPVAVAWIVALTLFPIPVKAHWLQYNQQFSGVTLVPFRTIRAQLAFGLEDSEARQLLGNVALFLPFGLLLPFAVQACRHLWVTLVVAASLSILMESLQAILPGHTTDVDDVILNTLGAALGYLAFSVLAWIGKQRTAPEERTVPRSASSSAG